MNPEIVEMLEARDVMNREIEAAIQKFEEKYDNRIQVDIISVNRFVQIDHSIAKVKTELKVL